MPGPALESAVFTAAGATVGRRCDAHAAADIVNVKNFKGSDGIPVAGDGTHDDREGIQAAVNYALGTSGSPHGTSTELNKPLFFPSGNYQVSDEIVFTQVKRGRIFGAVSTQIQLPPGSTNKKIFRINGMEDTLIENLGFHCSGTSTGNVLCDLDWNGSGSVGLARNTFRKVSAGGQGSTDGATGFRIANSGNGGAGNAFWNCIAEFIGIGFHIVGANATNQTFQGICGGSESLICWKVDGGSIGTITGVSNAGTNVQLDIQINNASTVMVQGVRSEASWFLELNASGAKAMVAAATVGSAGHTGTQQNIKMAPGTTLVMDGVVTWAVVATSPGTTPKPVIYKRGGSFIGSGFQPSSSDFTLTQNI